MIEVKVPHKCYDPSIDMKERERWNMRGKIVSIIVGHLEIVSGGIKRIIKGDWNRMTSGNVAKCLRLIDGLNISERVC